jgi:hypothetical protein
MDYTLRHFRNAGSERLMAAAVLLDIDEADSPKRVVSERKRSARLRAQLAAYLVQVGLECWLKARILAMHLGREKVPAVRTYRERFGVPDRDGRKRSVLFDSAEGHGLALLARSAELERLLCAHGQPRTLMSDRIWGRMTNGERPYSLRYGAESILPDDARAELGRAQVIENLVARNIPLLWGARR